MRLEEAASGRRTGAVVNTSEASNSVDAMAKGDGGGFAEKKDNDPSSSGEKWNEGGLDLDEVRCLHGPERYHGKHLPRNANRT